MCSLCFENATLVAIGLAAPVAVGQRHRGQRLQVLRGGSLVIGALVINELLGWRSRAGSPRIQTVDQHPQ